MLKTSTLWCLGLAAGLAATSALAEDASARPEFAAPEPEKIVREVSMGFVWVMVRK